MDAFKLAREYKDLGKIEFSTHEKPPNMKQRNYMTGNARLCSPGPPRFFAPIEEGGPWGLTFAAPRVLPPGAKKPRKGLGGVKKLEAWAGCLCGRPTLALAPQGPWGVGVPLARPSRAE